MNAAVSITNHTHGMRRLNFHLRIPFSLVFLCPSIWSFKLPIGFLLKTGTAPWGPPAGEELIPRRGAVE